MKRILQVTFLLCLAMDGVSQSEPLAIFSITPQMDMPPQPLYMNVDRLNSGCDEFVVLHTTGKTNAILPTQISPGETSRLFFMPGHILEAEVRYDFEIHRMDPAYRKDVVFTRIDKDHIEVLSDETPVLKYRHSMSYPPEGISPLYRKKGAYIHPLYSPSGKVLTNIRPEDHYHHFGIWAPWTRTKFEGREVDFWNLAAGQGTVRHSAILSSWSGPVSAGFRVYHEYVDFTSPGADKTAMNETWKVSAFSIKLDNRPVWMLDFMITLNCASDSTVELLQYRYGGGITYRATADWNRKNLSLYTSEGKTRSDADGSRARWCMIQGVNNPGDTSGLVFFSHPENREHPEPMRVWPEDAVNGRGDLMFEFCPIRHNAWTLEPGREYVLKYRLLLFDGTLDTVTINNLWYYYAHPPNPRITYLN